MEHIKRTNSDFLLPIFDIWVSPEIPRQYKKVVAYSPTDHDPPAMFLQNSLKECWKIIPFTQWSKDSMEKVGLKTMDWIPHGIDLNIFKPMDKIECRKIWNIKKEHLNDFFIGIVAGNYDKEGRKRWDKQLETLRIFKDQNPDCPLKIWLHTDASNVVHGFDLHTMIRFFNLQDIVYIPDPYYFITNLPYERMGEIYNMLDIHLLASAREGFGMPILESQACGIPCLHTDFAAGKEMVHPDLRIKIQTKIMTPIISWSAVPDAWDAAEKLGVLWKSPDKMEKYRKWGMEFAQKYDWNGELVKGRWIKALDIIEQDLKTFKEPEVKK
jgi:glycosyltransferase involved in cell wall biosynthesis